MPQRSAVGRGTQRPVEAGASGVVAASRIEADDPACRIDRDEAPADRDRACGDHASVVDDGEFRRAAADIQIENAAALLTRQAHCPRPWAASIASM